MPRPMKMALLLLCCAAPLTACAGSKEAKAPPVVVVRTEMVKPVVPDDLLACDVPRVPGVSWQSDVADYLAALHYAASVCARKMAALREIVR